MYRRKLKRKVSLATIRHCQKAADRAFTKARKRGPKAAMAASRRAFKKCMPKVKR